MNNEFKTVLTDYILSGHAYLHAHTPEKTRFVQELKEVAAELPPDGRPIFVWSPATSWQDAEGKPARTDTGAELGPPNPQMAPQQILELPEEALFVLKDFGCYLQSRTFAYFDIVLAWLSEIRDVLAHTGRTVLFVGVDFEIPPALQHDVTTIEFRLPNDAAIEKAVRFVSEDHSIDEDAMPCIVTACWGDRPGRCCIKPPRAPPRSRGNTITSDPVDPGGMNCPSNTPAPAQISIPSQHHFTFAAGFLAAIPSRRSESYGVLSMQSGSVGRLCRMRVARRHCSSRPADQPGSL